MSGGIFGAMVGDTERASNEGVRLQLFACMDADCGTVIARPAPPPAGNPWECPNCGEFGWYQLVVIPAGVSFLSPSVVGVKVTA
jgi:hypothetical protein